MTLAITEQAVASFSHHTWSAAVQPVSHTRLTTVQCIINFSFCGLRAKFAKGDMTYYPSRFTILHDFSPIVQTIYEICVTKVFFTFWPRGPNPWATVHQQGRWPASHLCLSSYQISSPCISPCPRYPLQKILRTDRHTDRQTHSKRYIASMPIGMRG